MKRIAFLVLACLLLLLSLTSCSRGIAIEEYEWELRYALHHTEESYAAVAVSADMAWSHPEAEVIEARLVASRGEITIVDFTNEMTYTGTYRKVGTNPDGSVEYKITLGDTEGRGVTAMTTYYEGEDEPTLPMAIGDYSMYFYAYQGE